MQLLKTIITLVKNKYLIALAIFGGMLLFFDRNDVFTQIQRKKELAKIEAKRDFYKKEIERTQKELNDLQNNPAALEKYARENFFMKKQHEDIFIIDTATIIK